MWWPLAVVAVAPRVVPMTLATSRVVLGVWEKEKKGGMGEKNGEFSRSLRKYEVPPSENLGVVALVRDEEPRALALLEKIGPVTVMLWDVTCVDDSSGTLLVRSLVAAAPRLHAGTGLADRWRLALALAR